VVNNLKKGKTMLSHSAEIYLIPCLSDNYGIIIRTIARGSLGAKTIVIDSPDADLLMATIKAKGFESIDFVLNTHKHFDHIGGNQRLKDLTGCKIWGPHEIQALSPVDRFLAGGDCFEIGGLEFEVLDLSGHTMGLIGYYCAQLKSIFLGDALFPLGCGRMFEGTASSFWASMERLLALPPDTLIYCAHEYALSNAEFALSLQDADEPLRTRVHKLITQREQGLPTVPSILSDEIMTNPFLVHPLKCPPSERVEKFGQIRALKDQFQTTGTIKL
jgi:hydroxyacylglutathione hydrolase